MKLRVIDLFAGPGGLGEGFSSYETVLGERPFRICLSVEKDVTAHRTIELRSFFRQFGTGSAPEAYYQYLRREITREELFSRYRAEAEAARQEAMHAELGVHDDRIDERINAVLGTHRDDPWVLIGGPPCQAYSTVGRSRMRGADPKAFEADKRHHLYKEYLRILAQFGPAVFVMENVAGLLSAKVNGHSTLDLILKDLRRPVRQSTIDCRAGGCWLRRMAESD
mgnify:CR=1 FL=1